MEISNLNSEYSNYGKDGIDRSRLITAILYAFEHPELNFDDIINTYLVNNVSNDNDFINKVDYVKLKEYLDLETMNEYNKKNFSWGKYIDTFLRLSEKINNSLEQGSVYSEELANQYLDAFYELAKLTFCGFSKREMFRKLSLFEYMLFPQMNYKKDSGYKYGYQSIFDPFAYQTLQRSVFVGAKGMQKMYSDDSKTSYDLWKDWVGDQVKKEFTRHMSLPLTYRVSLTNDDNLLVYPTEELSSVSETKPIELFEKIKRTIISNQSKAKDNILNIRVTIIGYTEISNDNQEKDLNDLILHLLSWYKRQGYERKLNLEIKNIISKNDYSELYSKNRNNFSYSDGDNSVSCVFEKQNMFNLYQCSNKKLCEEIENADVLFLLDCPWLYTKDQEQRHISCFTSPINNFANNLISRSRICSDKIFDSKLDSMQKLSCAYECFMSSWSELEYVGAIKRILDNEKIKAIKNIVTNYSGDKYKEVYIYCGEDVEPNISGLNMEDYENYMFTKRKVFYINNYYWKRSMSEVTNISEMGSSRITLYNLLKRISISSIYNSFKNIVDECLDGNIIKSWNYSELCQNSLIKLEVNDSFDQMGFSIMFTKEIDDICIENNIDPDIFKRAFSDKLTSFTNDLFYDMFNSRDTKYHKDIQNAFCESLYDDACNIKDLFLAIYFHNTIFNDKNSLFVFIPNTEKNYEMTNNRFNYCHDKVVTSVLINELFFRDFLSIVAEVALFKHESKYFKTNGVLYLTRLYNFYESMMANIDKESNGYGNIKVLSDNASKAYRRVKKI